MSLDGIKRKITSIQTTEKITNAMKLVASAKLQKKKRQYQKSKEYYDNYYEVIGKLLSIVNVDEVLNIEKQIDSTLWITINSNMGMCGGYNNNINKLAKKWIQPNDKIVNLGRKSIVFFKKTYSKEQFIEELDIASKFIDVDNLSEVQVDNIIKIIYDLYLKGNFNKIKIIYTKFINAISFEPTVIELLPINKELLLENKNIKEDEYEFEPNKEEIIKFILPVYLSTLLNGAIEESSISENASRRNAMDTATNNAIDLTVEYKLKYNRLRQSGITNQITEIIAGNTDEK